VFHWNRLSDHIGRKPVLLACIGGTAVSMVLFGLSRSFWAIVLRYPSHTSWRRRSLTCSSQPLSAWCGEGKPRRREKCHGRTHRRDEYSAGIFIVADDLGNWHRVWVRHLPHHLSLLGNISSPLAHSSVASYHDRKIAGQARSRILSGINIHTSSRALFLVPFCLYLSSL
jgi:MFS family permease